MDYTTKFIHLVSHYRRVATASLRVLFYLALTTHVLGLNHGCLFKSEIVKKHRDIKIRMLLRKLFYPIVHDALPPTMTAMSQTRIAAELQLLLVFIQGAKTELMEGN